MLAGTLSCSGSSTPAARPQAGADPTGSSSSPPKKASGSALEACALLSETEVAGFLGGPVVSHRANSDDRGCTWEVDSPVATLDLTIGSRGTAPRPLTTEILDGGAGFYRDAQPVPGLPEGQAFSKGSHMLSFRADNRLCDLVITSLGLSSSEQLANGIASVKLLVPRIEAP